MNLQSILSLVNCKFLRINSPTQSSAALYVVFSILSIDSCIFTDTSAFLSDAVFFLGGAAVIKGTQFSKGSGFSANLIFYYSQVLITDCEFFDEANDGFIIGAAYGALTCNNLDMKSSSSISGIPMPSYLAAQATVTRLSNIRISVPSFNLHVFGFNDINDCLIENITIDKFFGKLIVFNSNKVKCRFQNIVGRNISAGSFLSSYLESDITVTNLQLSGEISNSLFLLDFYSNISFKDSRIDALTVKSFASSYSSTCQFENIAVTGLQIGTFTTYSDKSTITLKKSDQL